MRFTVLCNPENRRVRFFRDAVRARGGSCEILPWAEFLRGDRQIDADQPIRIESPGENWAVESALLGRSEPEDRGRIRGLEPAYERLVGALGELPDAQYFTGPKAIAAMFDKVETKRRLDEIGVPTPRTYGLVRSFDELAEVMAANRQRAFVKPRHGSSASGSSRSPCAPTKCSPQRPWRGPGASYTTR